MQKETNEERRKRELDLQLDRDLESTFPASDALQITLKEPARPAAKPSSGSRRKG